MEFAFGVNRAPLSPICSSLMMSLRFRRQSILYLIIGFVVKLITFFPLVKYTGFSSAITSSVVTSLVTFS